MIIHMSVGAITAEGPDETVVFEQLVKLALASDRAAEGGT